MDTKTILGSLEVDGTETPRDGKVQPDWFISSEKIQVRVQTYQGPRSTLKSEGGGYIRDRYGTRLENIRDLYGKREKVGRL
jgi:hypothetical protein